MDIHRGRNIAIGVVIIFSIFLFRAFAHAADSYGSNVCLFALIKGELRDNGATPWFAELSMGTPGQSMTVMMDTGTANFWVTSSDCTSPACQSKIFKYDPERSVSHETVSNATWQNNDLGSWGRFQSLALVDYLSFQDGMDQTCKVKLKMLAARLEDAPGSTNWCDLDMSGGVGFPVIFDDPDDPNKPESLLPELIRAGLVDDPVVSFWSDQTSGTCLVGGVDDSCFKASTANVVPLADISDKINLWTIKLDQLNVGSTPVLDKPVNLALDTGSSRFKGSPEIIRHLIESITLMPDNTRLPTTFTDPEIVRQYPVIILDINGQGYMLRPEDYIWKIAGTETYSLQFHPMDIGDDNTILVGSVLLDQLYTVFEYESDTTAPYGLRGSRVHLCRRER